VAGRPVSVNVDAELWQFYSGGILGNCGTNVNHVALIVGYDTKDAYWLIKNTWGKHWGEKGYIRV